MPQLTASQSFLSSADACSAESLLRLFPYRDVQHYANDNDCRQKSRASQEEPVVRQDVHVRIGHNLPASSGSGSGNASGRRIAIFGIVQAPLAHLVWIAARRMP